MVRLTLLCVLIGAVVFASNDIEYSDELRYDDPTIESVGSAGHVIGDNPIRVRAPSTDWEFAPASRAGLTGLCQTTAAKTPDGGSFQFFTSGGNAWCPKKGIARTGISASDFDQISSSVPMIVSNSDGGWGVLTYGQKTNYCPRSEELNNAVWSDFNGGGAAAPTLNAANAIVGPPYGLYALARAEDYTFPATTGAEYSARAQTTACAITEPLGSLWVLAHDGGAGTIDICSRTSSCLPCNYDGGLWTQCVSDVGDGGNTGNGFYIGNMTAYNGGIARDEARVYLTGAQCERQELTPYKATGAGNMVDDGPLVSFAMTNIGTDAGGFCVKANVDMNTRKVMGATAAIGFPYPYVYTGATNYFEPQHTNGENIGVTSVAMVSSGVTSFTSTLDVSPGLRRYSMQHTNSTFKICVDSTCETSGASSVIGGMNFTSIRLGPIAQNSAYYGMQVWSDVLATNNPECEN